MNKNAKKWVKALRSGKYKQGRLRLRKRDTFCCLGVACELAKKAGVMKTYSRFGSFLPIEVKNWLGLKTVSGSWNSGHESLTEMNDNGKSFKFIARHIEQKQKELFDRSTKNGQI